MDMIRTDCTKLRCVKCGKIVVKGFFKCISRDELVIYCTDCGRHE